MAPLSHNSPFSRPTNKNLRRRQLLGAERRPRLTAALVAPSLAAAPTALERRMRGGDGGAGVPTPQNPTDVLNGAPAGDLHLIVATPEIGALLVGGKALTRQTTVTQMIVADETLGRIA